MSTLNHSFVSQIRRVLFPVNDENKEPTRSSGQHTDVNSNLVIDNHKVRRGQREKKHTKSTTSSVPYSSVLMERVANSGSNRQAVEGRSMKSLRRKRDSRSITKQRAIIKRELHLFGVLAGVSSNTVGKEQERTGKGGLLDLAEQNVRSQRPQDSVLMNLKCSSTSNHRALPKTKKECTVQLKQKVDVLDSLGSLASVTTKTTRVKDDFVGCAHKSGKTTSATRVKDEFTGCRQKSGTSVLVSLQTDSLSIKKAGCRRIKKPDNSKKSCTIGKLATKLPEGVNSSKIVISKRTSRSLHKAHSFSPGVLAASGPLRRSKRQVNPGGCSESTKRSLNGGRDRAHRQPPLLIMDESPSSISKQPLKRQNNRKTPSKPAEMSSEREKMRDIVLGLNEPSCGFDRDTERDYLSYPIGKTAKDLFQSDKSGHKSLILQCEENLATEQRAAFESQKDVLITPVDPTVIPNAIVSVDRNNQSQASGTMAKNIQVGGNLSCNQNVKGDVSWSSQPCSLESCFVAQAEKKMRSEIRVPTIAPQHPSNRIVAIVHDSTPSQKFDIFGAFNGGSSNHDSYLANEATQRRGSGSRILDVEVVSPSLWIKRKGQTLPTNQASFKQQPRQFSRRQIETDRLVLTSEDDRKAKKEVLLNGNTERTLERSTRKKFQKKRSKTAGQKSASKVKKAASSKHSATTTVDLPAGDFPKVLNKEEHRPSLCIKARDIITSSGKDCTNLMEKSRRPPQSTASSKQEQLCRTTKNEDIEVNGSFWNTHQVSELKMAHTAVDPKSSTFWADVAKIVDGKSVSECREKWFSFVKTPLVKQKKLKHSSRDHNDSSSAAIAMKGMVGAMDTDDDIFNSTPLRGKKFLGSASELKPEEWKSAESAFNVGSPIVNYSLGANNIKTEYGDPILFPSIRPKIGYKTYLRDMKRGVTKAVKEKEYTKQAKEKINTKSYRALSEKVGNGKSELNARLSPGGTLRVKEMLVDTDDEEIYFGANSDSECSGREHWE